MECAFDAGAVVVTEFADMVDHVLEVCAGNFVSAKDNFVAGKTGVGQPAQIHDDLKQILTPVRRGEGFPDLGRQRSEEFVQIVGDDLAGRGCIAGGIPLVFYWGIGRGSDTATLSSNVCVIAKPRAQTILVPSSVYPRSTPLCETAL